MEKQSVFTPIKKYSFVGIILLIFLAGCQGNGNEESTGWFQHYFVETFSTVIKSTAGFLGDNYGLSIILITLLVRLAIMPFMLKQMKKSAEMKKHMDVVKPEMDELRKKYSDKKDVDAQRKMQQEMMALYQKHGINPLASLAGCLPLLIQMPVLLGFYYAIRQTPEIATHSFLWFNLGQTDLLLTAIAVVIYFLQAKVSQINMAPEMKKQMAIMGYLSPIMIGIFSLNSPAALPLYWSVGGAFLIIQTLIAKKKYS
ncbi:membrane protein insertase YidC [Oceanobacillus manasiensis]|uniref:membrane protein insertase YidC n=1 Tax=Oceanobacillus manasiensis TaxID=586413 RepID=UPI0005AB3379|nr:membrane protein insertase YidC [Oceanobacillus manasiensis]